MILLRIALLLSVLTSRVQDAFLQELRPMIEALGLGVRTQWSGMALQSPPASPTVAPLRGFPSTASVPNDAAFVRLFNAGAHHEAALVAVRPRSGMTPPATAQQLARAWKDAPTTSRVFVSFTRADAAYARLLRLALETRGYSVFTYIRGDFLSLPFNAVEVGRFFREAGHHIVIDSREARKSVGVAAERLALEGRLLDRSIQDPIPGGPESGQPCCRVCTYVNSVRTGCGPVTCGGHCRNARPN